MLRLRHRMRRCSARRVGCRSPATQLRRCQRLYFSTSKASKVSTWGSSGGCFAQGKKKAVRIGFRGLFTTSFATSCTTSCTTSFTTSFTTSVTGECLGLRRRLLAREKSGDALGFRCVCTSKARTFVLVKQVKYLGVRRRLLPQEKGGAAGV